MSVNYAEKYSSVVDERFSIGSVTQAATNDAYDFVGVSTITVYSIPVAQMNNYSLSGSQRYGQPAELENDTQEMTLGQDRAFTYTIDRRSYDDTNMTLEAGASLARQIKDVVIPEIDAYRLGKMAEGAGTSVQTGITNAYDAFLDGTAALIDANVPLAGTICYCSTSFHKAIKLDDSFIKSSDLAQEALITGQVGMVDGIPLIIVPSSYLPERCNFILVNPMAVVSPMKLVDYKIHDNPPGINGWLIEGRVRYDAFVLDSKKHAIYVNYTPDTTKPALTAGEVTRTSNTAGTVKFTSSEAGKYYYGLVEKDATAPTIDTTGAGTACTTAETTITNPTGLTTGAMDIYIKVKDAAGNVSDALKIAIAAYTAG